MRSNYHGNTCPSSLPRHLSSSYVTEWPQLYASCSNEQESFIDDWVPSSPPRHLESPLYGFTGTLDESARPVFEPFHIGYLAVPLGSCT